MKVTLQYLLFSLFFITGMHSVSLGQSAGTALEKEIWNYANDYRKSKGKSALKYSKTIAVEARRHSCAMSSGKTGFGHAGFTTRTEHIKEQSGFFFAAAENVAYGNISAREVVDNWIKSPTHRKNLIGDYNLTGIGTCEGKNGRIYFTQIFIKQKVVGKATDQQEK